MKSIITVNGDITKCPSGINVIIHQANTQNIMGAGVALALRNRWPEIYEADSDYHDYMVEKFQIKEVAEEKMLGTFSRVYADNGQYRIMVINLYGQKLRRSEQNSIFPATDYSAVIAGLKSIKIYLDRLAKDQYIKVGIPFGMGCGLGGGDWNFYDAIIRVAFSGSKYEINYVKYIE